MPSYQAGLVGLLGRIRGDSEQADPMNDKERFDKFTEQARKVLSLAQEEAQRFNHNYIGTEHLLLGLIREGDSTAVKVLSNLGAEPDKVRSAVEFIIGRGDRIVLGDIGLTPRSKKVMELAVDEARRLNHHYVGTEHLLLGLVREGEGIAGGVLESLGVNLEKVRTQTIQVLNRGSSSHAVRDTTRPLPNTWELPALSVERLTHIQAEMQNTFRLRDRDLEESLDAAQGRAYSLARSMSELLASVTGATLVVDQTHTKVSIRTIQTTCCQLCCQTAKTRRSGSELYCSKPLKFGAGGTGIEPATCGFGDRCSA
jgi:hypothetical protein